jgi:hypothetical protein
MVATQTAWGGPLGHSRTKAERNTEAHLADGTSSHMIPCHYSRRSCCLATARAELWHTPPDCLSWPTLACVSSAQPLRPSSFELALIQSSSCGRRLQITFRATFGLFRFSCGAPLIPAA